MNLLDAFRKMMAHKAIPKEFLVPLLIWSSGSEKNIEVCQRINRKFFGGNQKVYILELSLSNNIEHIIKYPKISKNDEKLKFFYNDVCTFYDWTSRELDKNMRSLNFKTLKFHIAKVFG